MDITRLLPINQYNAAINANAPTAGNPFATMADLSGLGGEDLATTLGLGDTGAAGQNINLIGGILNLKNAGTSSSGPSCNIGGVTITPNLLDTTISTYACRPGLVQDLILTTHGFGSYVKIANPVSGGNGLAILVGNGEANLLAILSGTDRTYTFKDANGTVAFLSDITGTNSGINTGDQDSGTTFIITNDNTLRTIDANAINGNDLRDLVCTLIRDLNTAGVLTV